MSSYFQQILGMNSSEPSDSLKILGMNGSKNTETGAALQDVDRGIDEAKAEAEKRQKIEDLQRKLENLKAQREQVAQQVAEARKKRDSITDDEIVRMAKVKGIKDSDVSAYINGRISQRNADIAKIGNENAKDEIAAQKESAAAAKKAADEKAVKDKEDDLLELEKELNETIYTPVTAEMSKVRESKFALLKKQYEDAMADYKKLTGKDWNDKGFSLESAPATGATDTATDSTSVTLPEGSEKWSEADRTEYTRPETTETKRKSIEAKYVDKGTEADKAERKRKERVAENTDKGERAVSFTTAKSYAMKVSKDKKGKEKKTWTEIMTSWGWDVNNKKKAVK